MIGVRHLVDTAIGRELDAAIICEPEENELCLEQRGVVWARFRVRGKMAHGAMPEAGINPISCLGAAPPRGAGARAAAAAGLREEPLSAPADGDADDHPGSAARGGRAAVQRDPRGGRADARHAADAGHRRRRHPRRARGGRAATAAAACPGVKVEWEPVNAFRLATRVESSEALVQAMIGGVKAGAGRAPRYGGVPGSTDGTILRMELGIPIVTCGPGEPADPPPGRTSTSRRRDRRGRHGSTPRRRCNYLEASGPRVADNRPQAPQPRGVPGRAGRRAPHRAAGSRRLHRSGRGPAHAAPRPGLALRRRAPLEADPRDRAATPRRGAHRRADRRLSPEPRRRGIPRQRERLPSGAARPRTPSGRARRGRRCTRAAPMRERPGRSRRRSTASSRIPTGPAPRPPGGPGSPRADRPAHRFPPRRADLRVGVSRSARALGRRPLRHPGDLPRGHGRPVRRHPQAVRHAARRRPRRSRLLRGARAALWGRTSSPRSRRTAPSTRSSSRR